MQMFIRSHCTLDCGQSVSWLMTIGLYQTLDPQLKSIFCNSHVFFYILATWENEIKYSALSDSIFLETVHGAIKYEPLI